MTAEQDHDPNEDEDEFEDEIEDEIEDRDSGVGTPLQAAIAWIMTRNAELAFNLTKTAVIGAKIESIIRRARLESIMSQQEAWTQLKSAVSDDTTSMWGQEFELPPDYEYGGVWPRGPLRQLTSKDLSNTCLIDERGMAVRPFGIITRGQIWYCRVWVKTKELELTFPANGKAPETRPRRDHKSQAANEIYSRHLKETDGWNSFKAFEQLHRINEELRAANLPTIEMRTLTKIRNN